MSYAQASVDSDSHLSESDLNDWAEALITAVCEGDNTPDTPHSHDFDPCHGGNAHGQGAAVHSCGCYRRTKVESALADAFEQDQRLEPEDVDSWSVGGRSGEIWPLKRKRTFELDSVGDMTPRHPEIPKRRTLGKAFEFNSSTTHETSVLDIVKRLEAAIDRQTEVLVKICRALESRAK